VHQLDDQMQVVFVHNHVFTEEWNKMVKTSDSSISVLISFLFFQVSLFMVSVLDCGRLWWTSTIHHVGHASIFFLGSSSFVKEWEPFTHSKLVWDSYSLHRTHFVSSPVLYLSAAKRMCAVVLDIDTLNLAKEFQKFSQWSCNLTLAERMFVWTRALTQWTSFWCYQALCNFNPFQWASQPCLII
jgi:hypothetical protein